MVIISRRTSSHVIVNYFVDVLIRSGMPVYPSPHFVQMLKNGILYEKIVLLTVIEMIIFWVSGAPQTP